MIPRVIAVEGFDGSGKSSIANFIADIFGYEYLKSPSGKFQEIRNHFDIKNYIPEERLAFYTGDCIRISMLMGVLYPQRKYVLDRYYYSTQAYHHLKHPELVDSIAPLFTHLLKPDMILYIKTDYDIIIERLKKRENTLNDELFMSKENYDIIENNFYRYFSIEPVVVTNNGTLDDIKSKISALLNDEL